MFEARGRSGPIVRNKANSSIADCGLWIADWAPICGGTPALRLAASGLRGAVVQTKPIGRSQSCDNASLPGVVPATNPIRAGAMGRASPCWAKNYGELCMRRTSEKQTQFLNCGLRIVDCGLGTDLRRDACPAACRLGPPWGACTNKTNWPEPIVRNKANSRRSDGKGKSLLGKELW
jgi:hypothetical protein